MAFTYKRRSAKDVEKRATQSGSDFQGFILDEFVTWQPKKGENWIRILPPTWEDATHYGEDVWVHYQVGPDKGSVLCLQKMKNKACPICEERAKLSASGDEDEAKDIKPGRRVLMYIIDRNEEEKGPQVWAAPWTLDRDIAKVSKDRRSGELFYIDDPEEGYDVTFDKEGEGVGTKYTGVQLSRKPSAVSAKALKFITNTPLPEVLRWRDYDEVEEMFAGAEKDVPAKKRKPVDDDDAPPRRKRNTELDDDDEDDDAPPARKRRAPVDDDDEEDDEPAPKKKSKEPVDDDDDDNEPPRKKASVKKRQVEDNEEDDEPAPKKAKRRQPEEDDDDDEPPRSKLRQALAKEREKKPQAAGKRKRPVDDDDDEIPF